jgi:hypothetical protein
MNCAPILPMVDLAEEMVGDCVCTGFGFQPVSLRQGILWSWWGGWSESSLRVMSVVLVGRVVRRQLADSLCDPPRKW